MIIDSHTHIGQMLNFDMPAQMLIGAMDQSNISFSLASNVEAIEVDHKQEIVKQELQTSQLQSARHLIDIVKQYQSRLGCLIWCKPLQETVTDEFEQLLVENRDSIYALKFHPYHSKVAFNSEKMIPYFELARRLGLPVVTHTASDECSHPKHVYEMAKKYPDLNFVMVHLGLGTDNEEAISLIAQCENLYGDSTWVKPEKTLEAIKRCGAHKIMFGSDAPINGLQTYEDKMFYQFYLHQMKDHVSPEVYRAFMSETAQKVFNIKSC